MDKLRSFDLFAGLGGFALGLEATGYFETVGFCENDPYARAVLRKHWPDVPQFGDIKELTVDQIKEECGPLDIITGGYPCQPYSQAGKRRGHEDDRDLWPEMFRIVKGLRPSWVLGENVAGHITLGLDKTLSDLEAEGYETRVFVIPACAVDAPHRRDRVWIIAHGESKPVGTGLRPGEQGGQRRGRSGDSACKVGRGGQIIPNADRGRREGPQAGSAERDAALCGGPHADGARGGPREWPPEPGVARMVHGVPARMDRTKGLGNAAVPELVARIGLAIAYAHEQAILDKLGG